MAQQGASFLNSGHVIECHVSPSCHLVKAYRCLSSMTTSRQRQPSLAESKNAGKASTCKSRQRPSSNIRRDLIAPTRLDLELAPTTVLPTLAGGPECRCLGGVHVKASALPRILAPRGVRQPYRAAHEAFLCQEPSGPDATIEIERRAADYLLSASLAGFAYNSMYVSSRTSTDQTTDFIFGYIPARCQSEVTTPFTYGLKGGTTEAATSSARCALMPTQNCLT